MSGIDWGPALTWALFGLYAVVTGGLAVFAGLTSNKSAASFAIGSGQMSPWVVGVTLGASLASSATFVFYPGYVYTDGLGALMGFSVALVAGLLTGLVLFMPRFQDVGAKVAAPHRPAVSYAGDGAWGMSLMETMTAVRHNIPVTAVVFHNRQWGAEKKNQVDFYNRRFVAGELDNQSFAEIARAMGAEGIVVDKLEDLEDSVVQIFQIFLKIFLEILVVIEEDREAEIQIIGVLT